MLSDEKQMMDGDTQDAYKKGKDMTLEEEVKVQSLRQERDTLQQREREQRERAECWKRSHQRMLDVANEVQRKLEQAESEKTDLQTELTRLKKNQSARPVGPPIPAPIEEPGWGKIFYYTGEFRPTENKNEWFVHPSRTFPQFNQADRDSVWILKEVSSSYPEDTRPLFPLPHKNDPHNKAVQDAVCDPEELTPGSIVMCVRGQKLNYTPSLSSWRQYDGSHEGRVFVVSSSSGFHVDLMLLHTSFPLKKGSRITLESGLNQFVKLGSIL